MALPKNFPCGSVVYTAVPTTHPALTRAQLAALQAVLSQTAADNGAPTLHAPPLRGPCPLVAITRISDPRHPACGQMGLCATRNLAPGTLVMDYVGMLVGDAHADPASDYTLRLCPGLSMDAAASGNEARFVNDFRGVRHRPNCRFDLYADKSSGNAVRMGVWVVEAVKKGEELCVSYGKGFWSARRQEGGAGADSEWEVWEQRVAEAQQEQEQPGSVAG
mmetsp:Transcript_5587/g.13931  ORF Transcript_5587/g.13931 Transcript_5587/m.13931 type:complete len:220 (-) Transcript_5587:2144-2803(-)|eukprot:CAMPEP_0202863778 /NCGR_PEP_ID=MMETSP1391-20130828/4276_1 /ASSEMBLY_ACC=CAM_ASM_000867 /TAXON_ID=1034604 /ORGANISM="Chlamydomonas leiostraca, Strain SAG 11-49" /LENGTH=219 /DNA_ID=CAMNT_0049543449 /DNA_START=147 /DNA_END=806 /DNA_ORIENTATION=-